MAGAAPKPIKPVPALVAVSDDATTQHTRVRKLLPAAIRQKAEVAAKAFAAKSLESMTEAAVTDAARSDAAKLLSISTGDISALAFLVLMEAAKTAHEDLRAIMESVKQVNAEREKLRAATKQLGGKVKVAKKATAPAYLKKVTTAKTANLQLAYSVLPDISATVCESKDDEVCLDELQQKDDALAEMSEQMAMRMQMVMDRRSKALQSASNLLKKISDTQNSVIANMK